MRQVVIVSAARTSMGSLGGVMNTSHITELGNIVIREEAERRMKSKEKFVLVYCDLDNFKAFNDKYGVHAGDEVIIFTAKILNP